MGSFEVNVVNFLGYLMKEKCSYSVINSNRAMLMQILSLIRVDWINNQFLIPKLLKGYYNMNPPKPKCKITWDVSKVLHFLKDISLKKVDSENVNIEIGGVVCVNYCCKGPEPLCIEH